jgi:hypothetical protein
MRVRFTNQGEFVTSFAVEWNGGETDRTPEQAGGTTATIDLDKYQIAPGTSCWARAYIVAGVNHDSQDNFNYNPGPQAIPHYTIYGGASTPHFQPVAWDPADS